jgi:hypothetical protein
MDREAVIAAINAGSFPLSFSKLARFAECPALFMEYCTGEQKTTPAMLLGSFVHCLLLEGERWRDLYAIAPECDRRTTAGKAAWAEFIAQAGEDKEVISRADFIKASAMVEAVLKDPAASDILASCPGREIKVEGEIGGFRFTGKVDAMGPGILADLKKVADCEPDRLRRIARAEKYHVQQWIYNRLAPDPGANYLIGVDESLQVSVLRFTPFILAEAERDFFRILANFQACALNGSWAASYGFWGVGGMFEF